MKNPLVSVVIPTYNRKKMVERLLNSLLKSSYKNLDIIVIDDASNDGTFEYLKSKFKKRKSIRIFKNKKNLFAAGAKNVGQQKAKGKFIAFIDDDNVIDKLMIENLVEFLINNHDAGEVGPINYNYKNKDLVLLSKSSRSLWTTHTKHTRSLRDFKKLEYWEADDVPNSFMVRSDVVLKNRIKFKKSYGIMYEESDYAYRIRALGYKVYMLKSAKIYHDIEDNSKEKNDKDYLFHFLDDKRRPFVFARNRVVFHSLYSSNMQKIFIYTFWIWIFTIIYIYKFMKYKGVGDFKINDKLKASLNYFKGTLNGLQIAVFKKNYGIFKN